MHHCSRLCQAVLLFCSLAPAQGPIEWIAGVGGNPLGGPNQTRVPAKTARIYNGRGLYVDRQNRVLFAGGLDRRVWRITPGGDAEVIAGNRDLGTVVPGNALSTPFGDVSSVAEDAEGNVLVGDASFSGELGGLYLLRSTGRIERITTYSGNNGVLTSDGGQSLFHEAGARYFIYRRSPVSSTATPFAGDGGPFPSSACDGQPASGCSVGGATGMNFDPIRQELAWTWQDQAWLRESNGTLRLIAGNGVRGYNGDNISGKLARLSSPNGMVRAGNGILYIADSGNGCIRGVTSAGVIFAAVGICASQLPGLDDGARSDEGSIGGISGIAVSSTHLYWGDFGGRVWRIAIATLPTAGIARPLPTISRGGIADGASFSTTISNWGWSSVFGQNFTTQTLSWDGAIVNNRLPTALGGVAVTVNGQAAYISFVSPTQINFLVPPTFTSAASTANVVVYTTGGSATASVASSSIASQLFGFVQGAERRVFAFLNGAFVLAAPPGAYASIDSRPARAGDILTVYFTGGVVTNPAATAGVINTVPLSCRAGGPSILLDTQTVSAGYCGMISPGVFQINFRLPAYTTERDVDIKLDTGSAANTAWKLRVGPA